jgi:hypothetical protein
MINFIDFGGSKTHFLVSSEGGQNPSKSEKVTYLSKMPWFSQDPYSNTPQNGPKTQKKAIFRPLFTVKKTPLIKISTPPKKLWNFLNFIKNMDPKLQ